MTNGDACVTKADSEIAVANLVARLYDVNTICKTNLSWLHSSDGPSIHQS